MRDIRVKNCAMETKFHDDHNILTEIRNNNVIKGVVVYLDGTLVFETRFINNKHVIIKNGINENDLSESEKNNIVIDQNWDNQND